MLSGEAVLQRQLGRGPERVGKKQIRSFLPSTLSGLPADGRQAELPVRTKVL